MNTIYLVYHYERDGDLKEWPVHDEIAFFDKEKAQECADDLTSKSKKLFGYHNEYFIEEIELR